MPRRKAPPFLGPSPPGATDMLSLPGDSFDDFQMTQSREAARTELDLNRPVWTSDWVPVITGNRHSANDIARFPLYVKYERDPEGKLVLPEDRNVLLSDELVYAAMKELSQKKRAEFRAVWDANGEPRASRVPQDPSPRIDFHGLPCVPIWKHYYAFVGLRAAAKYGYLMVAKADLKLKTEVPVFTIGPIVLGYPFAEDAVADPAAVFQARQGHDLFPYPRSIVRQLHDHHGRYTTPWGGNTSRPAWSSHIAQQEHRPTTQPQHLPTTQAEAQPDDAISVSSSLSPSLPETEAQNQVHRATAQSQVHQSQVHQSQVHQSQVHQSQVHQADNEEKTLRDFVLPYKSIMENLDRIEPEIDDLRRLREHMSTYRQLQLRETALTDKTEAVAAATRITISKELNDLPDIQDRAIKRWEHLFHLPFKAETPQGTNLDEDENGNGDAEGPPYDPAREITPSDIYTPPEPSQD
ncbi:hypothetical protein N7501_000660 [Penicillium viridicatum]|nr:hypothetical protein N7501_000660 [Penicillium viridicatum]